MLCVDTSRKFPKNPLFWAKSISPQGRNFESISQHVGSSPEMQVGQIIGRGMTPPVEKYFRNFRPCGEILFAQNRGFFRNFRDVSTYNTPKISIVSILQYRSRNESNSSQRIASENEPRTIDEVEQPLSSDRTTEAKTPWIYLRTTVESLHSGSLLPLLVGVQ